MPLLKLPLRFETKNHLVVFGSTNIATECVNMEWFVILFDIYYIWKIEFYFLSTKVQRKPSVGRKEHRCGTYANARDGKKPLQYR